MYIVKISKEKELLGVDHYIHFENALADISDGSAFEKIIPQDKLDAIDAMGDWGRPRISCHSHAIHEKTGVADDFELKYDNGVLVYIGKIMASDTQESSC